VYFFFFSSRRRHTRSYGDWSSDVCSSDLPTTASPNVKRLHGVAADDCQRHDEAQNEPGRLVADERVCDEQAEGPRRREYREAIRSEERRVGKEGRSRWRP